MTQLSYGNQPIAYEGMHGDAGYDSRVVTAVDPANASNFGRAAILGTNPGEFQVPDGANGTLIGITVHSHSHDPSATSSTESVAATEPVNIMTKGRVWVIPEAEVDDITDGVFYRFQNAGAAPEGNGRFRPDNDGGSGDVAQITAGARWLSTGLAGTPVLLEINIPV